MQMSSTPISWPSSRADVSTCYQSAADRLSAAPTPKRALGKPANSQLYMNAPASGCPKVLNATPKIPRELRVLFRPRPVWPGYRIGPRMRDRRCPQRRQCIFSSSRSTWTPPDCPLKIEPFAEDGRKRSQLLRATTSDRSVATADKDGLLRSQGSSQCPSDEVCPVTLTLKQQIPAQPRFCDRPARAGRPERFPRSSKTKIAIQPERPCDISYRGRRCPRGRAWQV